LQNKKPFGGKADIKKQKATYSTLGKSGHRTARVIHIAGDFLRTFGGQFVEPII
jgi:hypothetical protein